MSKVQLVASALFLVLLLVACAPAAGPAPAPTAPGPAAGPAPAPTAPATTAPFKATWETQWEQVLAAARQEGRVVLATSLGGQPRQIVAKAFTEKYGIPVEALSAGSADVAAKISAEQRAGLYLHDVTMNGSGTYIAFKGFLDSLDPVLILPDLTDPELIKKAWFFGQLSWADKDHTMVIALMDLQLAVAVNANLVKPGEIRTYSNLLDPKWKGKISLMDPRLGGMGRMWFSAVLELKDVDTNFMRELVTKQELFVTRDRQLQVNWLAQGKHAIALGPNGPTVEQFINVGAPLTRFNPGTPFMSGGASSGVGVWKRAPHPNATKVFINWLLSQEGQGIHSEATVIQSQRIDASTASVRPEKLITQNMKVYNASNEEFDQKREESVYPPLANEVFGR